MNRAQNQQDFLIQLPIDISQDDLGPLSWLSTDERLFFGSSWWSSDQARGAHGLPYSELPEHAWVSSSSFLLERLATEGHSGIQRLEQTEVLEQYVGQKRGRESELSIRS